MMKNNMNFKQIGSDFNSAKKINTTCTMKDLQDIFRMCSLPTAVEFINMFIEAKVINKEGTVYTFNKEPTYHGLIETLYHKFRDKRNAYIKKHNQKKQVAASDTITEEMIQEAIKLLKNQGDRFKITEKIVSVEYKAL